MTQLAPDPPPRRIERRLHGPVDGIPYYDHELDLPQSHAHRVAVGALGSVLESIAKDAGLIYLSDEPIWYLHPEDDVQKVYYGDCVVAQAPDPDEV